MFNGRYGADSLGFILITASILLSVVAALLKAENIVMKMFLLVISGGLTLFAAYRVFSHNIRRRKRELHLLHVAEAKILSLFGKKLDTDKDEEEEPEKEEKHEEPQVTQVEDEYRHFRCPRCKKSLKVPAGKGYIKVVCPSCSYKFMRHT